MNRKKKHYRKNIIGPNPNLEYFCWQSLGPEAGALARTRPLADLIEVRVRVRVWIRIRVRVRDRARVLGYG